MKFSFPPLFNYDNEPSLWQNPYEFKQTIQIIKGLKTTSLLEIGTGYGLFAKYLMNIIHIFVISIDKAPLATDLDNLLIADSQDDEAFHAALKNSPAGGQYDVVYIDGGHDYATSLSDVRKYKQLAKKALIIHDVDGNQEGKYPVKLGPYTVWQTHKKQYNTMTISAKKPENCGVGIILL